MLRAEKIKSMSGYSEIEVDGNYKTAVAMNAQRYERGNMGYSVSIVDQELYDNNKAQCDEEIAQFKQYAEEYLADIE